MKRFFIKEIRLSEGSLYGKSMITNLTNRFKDNSDDIVKKINIAGLYRDFFGNIQQDTKESFEKKYQQWYDKSVNAITKTIAFNDDERGAKTYLDAYVNNIGSLGQKAKPFFYNEKSIEKNLVDVVNANGWIDTGKEIKNTNKLPIYKPEQKDIIYEDYNIIILDGKSKGKCIRYGKGESWCISRSQGHYYSSYRFQSKTTIYFVLQKNEKYPEHKIVILNWGRGYAIADQTNSGDRSGTHIEEWSSIEKQIPNLKGKEKYFAFQDITESEQIFEDIIRKYRHNEDMPLNEIIEELYNKIPQPSEYSKEDVLLALVLQLENQGDKFSEANLRGLSDEYISALIEIPYMFDKNSLLNILTDKQKRRYYKRLKAFDKFNDFLSSQFTDGGVSNNKDILMDIFKNSDIKIDYFTVHMVEFYYENKNNPEIIERIINYNKIITNSAVIDIYTRNDEKGEFIKLLLDNNVLMIDSDIIETLRENNFTEKIINELLENFINKLASGELTQYLNNEELYTYTDLYNIYVELVKKGVDVKNLKYKKYNISELNNINRNYIKRIESSKFDKTYIDFLIFLIEKRICNIQISSFKSLYENADDSKKELLKPLIEVIFNENK